MGTNISTCGCRKKPVSGNTGTDEELEEVIAVAATEEEIGFSMIRPRHDMRRGKT